MTDPGFRLTANELADFLALGITARLACLDSDAWPYNVPVWHQWDGEHFWVIGARDARWVHYIQADPRVCLCIDEPESLTRVIGQGRAQVVEGPSLSGRWETIARHMAVRYLGEDALADYESASRGYERWLVRIETRRLLSWRGAGRSEGEPVTIGLGAQIGG